MPRYYFHVIGRRVERDEIGTELPSAACAMREGGRFIGALLADGMLDRTSGTLMLEVMDETGSVFFQLDVTSWNAPVVQAA